MDFEWLKNVFLAELKCKDGMSIFTRKTLQKYV